jgi:hypothetical protein
MENKESIHVQGIGGLTSLSFQMMPFPKGSQPDIRICDTVSTSDLSLEGFKIRYVRKISFEPVGVFSAEAVFEADVTFENDAGKKELKSLDKVASWVEKNKVRIINTFCYPCVASNALSNVAVSAGFRPIITNPSFQGE